MKIVKKGGGTVLSPGESNRCIHEYSDGGISVRCNKPASNHYTHTGWTALGNQLVEWTSARRAKKID